jgi:AraC family transcriptional regulator of adaptative response/methylated-DNA-[protein]-cysteine methyltransferase
VGAESKGIVYLEFADAERERPEWMRETAAEGREHLEVLERELASYFAGDLQEFTVPVAPVGTDFQRAVWAELRRIPYGTTISYATLAERIGRPTACRAVAGANGANRLAIVIPCHRVIGKDGTLTGYGGGLWRKQRLLALEGGKGTLRLPVGQRG